MKYRPESHKMQQKPTKYKLRLFQLYFLRRLIFTTLQALLSGILVLSISRSLQDVLSILQLTQTLKRAERAATDLSICLLEKILSCTAFLGARWTQGQSSYSR